MLQNPSQLIRSLPLQLEWQTRAVLRAPDQGFKLGQLKIYLKKILDSTNLEINQLFFGPKRTEASPSIDLLRTKLLMVCNSLSSGCWLQKQTTDISFFPPPLFPLSFYEFRQSCSLGWIRCKAKLGSVSTISGISLRQGSDFISLLLIGAVSSIISLIQKFLFLHLFPPFLDVVVSTIGFVRGEWY